MTDTQSAAAKASPLAVICGGGTLPGTVAKAAVRAGRSVLLFPIRGNADAAVVEEYPHHWLRFGQADSFRRLAQAAGCHDVVWIGTMLRPALHEIRPDFLGLRLLPSIVRAFRGGDDRLLSGLAELFAQHGFRLVGAQQIAPEILIPEGALGARRPSPRDLADIERGLALLRATGPFDIGQAAVVADQRVLAIEAAEGTDGMLAHVAAMRREGRIRTATGVGVLVKAPKAQQDRRFDLPAIGPTTIDGVVAAGLAGLAVVAGSSIIAEPERVVAVAERAGIFVVGVRERDGTAP